MPKKSNLRIDIENAIYEAVISDLQEIERNTGVRFQGHHRAQKMTDRIGHLVEKVLLGKGRATRYKVAESINEPVIETYHAALERSGPDSAYKSDCPVCITGVLPVRRCEETYCISNQDRCTHCAQSFIYKDEIIAGENVEKGPEGIEPTTL